MAELFGNFQYEIYMAGLSGQKPAFPIAYRDLEATAKLMIEANGRGNYELHDFPADRRAIDIGDYYADFTKIRTQLGWEPKRALRETIETTLSYFKGSLSHYL